MESVACGVVCGVAVQREETNDHNHVFRGAPLPIVPAAVSGRRRAEFIVKVWLRACTDTCPAARVTQTGTD